MNLTDATVLYAEGKELGLGLFEFWPCPTFAQLLIVARNRKDFAMSYWVVVFEDDDGMLAHRKAHGAAHIAYLRAHEDQIVTAGGFRDDPDGAFVGGMWIVKHASKDQVEALVENDPYYNTECRRFRIQFWGKAIDRMVSV